MKTQIIILSGKAQSGKDTGCEALQDWIHSAYYPAETKKYAFAQPIKDFCINVLGLEHQQAWGTDEEKNQPTHILWKDMPLDSQVLSQVMCRETQESGLKIDLKTPMSGRQIMQIFGTEICRKMYGDCWVRATVSAIKKDNLNFALISDCRFPNEIDYLKEYDPIVLRLARNPLDKHHDSETALDDYDWDSIKRFSHISNGLLSMDSKNKKIIQAFTKHSIRGGVKCKN